MSRLEQAIKNIVEVFEEYADGDGKLNKEELKNLLEKEIENPEIKAKISAADFNKIMRRADKNHDGEINLKEFSLCVGFITKVCYHKKTGKCQEGED